MSPPLGGRQPTVGFDLDMTLFDTRPGVKKVWQALAAHTGLDIDADVVITRLGPPLAVELVNWAPPDRTDELVALYRDLYPEHAIEPAVVMPGAVESLLAVHAVGGRTMLVTAKLGEHAQRHVDHAGLAVDVVVGDLWGSGKGRALTDAGASIYVGDHVLDVAGAHAAGALAVCVPTGPCSSDELVAAGADAVLADLTEFPAWFAQWYACRL